MHARRQSQPTRREWKVRIDQPDLIPFSVGGKALPTCYANAACCSPPPSRMSNFSSHTCGVGMLLSEPRGVFHFLPFRNDNTILIFTFYFKVLLALGPFPLSFSNLRSHHLGDLPTQIEFSGPTRGNTPADQTWLLLIAPHSPLLRSSPTSTRASRNGLQKSEPRPKIGSCRSGLFPKAHRANTMSLACHPIYRATNSARPSASLKKFWAMIMSSSMTSLWWMAGMLSIREIICSPV